MPRLSIKALLAGVSALTVTLVAAVTLGMTISTSVDALRRIGRKHADALLTIADVGATALVRKGEDSVLVLANATRSRMVGHHAFPSVNNESSNFFDGTVRSVLLLGYPEVYVVQIDFRDNSEIGATTEGDYYTHRKIIPNEPYNASAHPAVRQQQFLRSMETFNLTTSEPMPVPEAYNFSASIGRPRDTGLWETLALATFGGFAPVAFTPVAFRASQDARLVELLPMVIPIHHPGEDPSASEPCAYGTVSLSIESLTQFLRSTRSTPGTVAFAYDSNGYIFAASSDISTRTVQPIQAGTGARVPPGCSSTEELALAIASDTEHLLVCRQNLREFPHDGLRSLAASAHTTLYPAAGTRSVKTVSAGGETYYAASLRVSTRFRGVEMFLLMLVPEEDIIGDVIASRNAAFIVTSVLVLVGAAVNVVLVFVVLSPLANIAQRMVRAADFEDDGIDGNDEAMMSEVWQLQQAFSAMTGELSRLRAYVPQTVLLSRKVEADGALNEDELDFADGQTSFGDDTVSMRSSRSSRGSRSRSRRGSYFAKSSSRAGGDQGLNASGHDSSPALVVIPSLEGSTATRQVSVVVANICGLHTLQTAPEAAREIEAAATAMETAVSAGRGALTFHGDRFLATFNAAQLCASHPHQAAHAAINAAASRTGVLSMSFGVATGRCFVGPMGCEGVKNFGVVGPTVTIAAALERLSAHEYHGGVVAAHRTAAEASTSLNVRYVDLFVAPGTSPKPLAVAVLTKKAQHEQPPEQQQQLHTIPSAPDSRYDAQAANQYISAPAGTSILDEWVDKAANVDALFNGCFEELHRSRIEDAIWLYQDVTSRDRHHAPSPNASMEPPSAMNEGPSASSAAAAAAATRPPPRLTQIMEGLLNPKEPSSGAPVALPRPAHLLALCRPLAGHAASGPQSAITPT